MHINAQLAEDGRGHQEVRTRLYLHGSVDLPENPTEVLSWSKANRGRLVGHETTASMGQARPLADLDVFAPDQAEHVLLKSALTRPFISVNHGAFIVQYDSATISFISSQSLDRRPSEVYGQLAEAAIHRLEQRHALTALRASRIELKNFRGIDALVLDLSASRTSILVGVNGAGKTSLLDALALVLSQFESVLRTSGEARHGLTDDDIMNGRESTSISLMVSLGEETMRWSVSKERQSDPIDDGDQETLRKRVATLRHNANRGRPCLPIIAYYPVNRAVLDIPLRIRTKHLFDPLAAYDGALKGGLSNFRLFFEWFRNREDLENEQRAQTTSHRDGQLEAVRQAIGALVPQFSDLRVQRSPLRMVVTKGEWILFINQLSDGEKCLLAMAGDLARRLALANPLMDDPLRGGGVVFIDEIELHLHPGWQRAIIPALERTFPNCQFIITTHSPQVLGHVPHEAVHVLEMTGAGVAERRPDATLGMDANRILEDVLGVPERPAEFKQKILRIARLIDEDDLPQARVLIEELSAVLGPNAPETARAEVRLMRKERLGR